MNDKKISQEMVSEEMERMSGKLSQKELNKDLDVIVSSKRKINSKSEYLKTLKFPMLFNQVKLAFEMINDYRSKAYRDLPWKTITLLTVAFLYFINPFDLIPDFIPIIGYGDDALAFAGVLKAVQSDLKKYCTWKGYDAAKYF